MKEMEQSGTFVCGKYVLIIFAYFSCFVFDYFIYSYIRYVNTEFMALHTPHYMNKIFSKFTFIRKEGNHIGIKVQIKAYSTNNFWLNLEKIQVCGSTNIESIYYKHWCATVPWYMIKAWVRFRLEMTC
jgi:hypothetical protein